MLPHEGLQIGVGGLAGAAVEAVPARPITDARTKVATKDFTRVIAPPWSGDERVSFLFLPRPFRFQTSDLAIRKIDYLSVTRRLAAPAILGVWTSLPLPRSSGHSPRRARSSTRLGIWASSSTS